MNPAEKALRNARILHAWFFLASIAYVLVPLVVIKTQTNEINPAIVVAVSLIAVSDLGIATFFRSKMVKSAGETLAQNPEDAGAAAK
jgi:surface polysaccharide O-acyltransferase-like enzyme